MALLSKRVFTSIAFYVRVDRINETIHLDQEKNNFHLDYLLNPNDDTPEWVFALQDIGDKVLDLKVGEHFFYTPDRDNNETFAILFRNK
jgi:hypothetical protein